MSFTDIAEVINVLSEPTYTASRFLFQQSDQIVSVGSQLTYKIGFFDAFGNPIKDTNEFIKILPLQFPPSLYGLVDPSLGIIFQMNKFISIDTLVTRTDLNGQISIVIHILPNYFGKWGICFFAGGVCSSPVFVKTINPTYLVNVLVAPSFPGANFPIGIRLPTQPVVSVTGLNGIPIQNTAVVAIIVPSGNAIPSGLIDVLSSDANPLSSYETYLTTLPEGIRFQRTDALGMANFTNFSLLDVVSTACFSFKFIVGEPGLYIESIPTKNLCFYNDYSFRIITNPSQTIGDNQPFILYPIIEVTKNQSGTNPMVGSMLFASYITDIDGNAVSSQSVYSLTFLDGYTCYYNGL